MAKSKLTRFSFANNDFSPVDDGLGPPSVFLPGRDALLDRVMAALGAGWQLAAVRGYSGGGPMGYTLVLPTSVLSPVIQFAFTHGRDGKYSVHAYVTGLAAQVEVKGELQWARTNAFEHPRTSRRISQHKANASKYGMTAREDRVNLPALVLRLQSVLHSLHDHMISLRMDHIREVERKSAIAEVRTLLMGMLGFEETGYGNRLRVPGTSVEAEVRGTEVLFSVRVAAADAPAVAGDLLQHDITTNRVST